MSSHRADLRPSCGGDADPSAQVRDIPATRRRVKAAWNHQNGDSPINNSAEVHRTAQALGAQPERPPKIGADLENIAAALAEAQKPHFCFPVVPSGCSSSTKFTNISGARARWLSARS
jgi:hypothetical protein